MNKKYLQQKEGKEDTTIISGREITITQVPHLKAEVNAARNILQKLQSKRPEAPSVYTSEVVKTIEI